MTAEARSALHAARAAEKEQTLFYRALAADAEDAGNPSLAERLNELLADEQHHLSRLTARLLELGEPVPDPRVAVPAIPSLDAWEAAARERERTEVARYEAIAALDLDEPTAHLVRDALRVERQHERNLAGKWTAA